MKEYIVKYKNITNKIRKIYDEDAKKIKDLSKHRLSKRVTSFVRKTTIKVDSFSDLIMEIAELSNNNSNVMLFFRGQTGNYIKGKHFNVSPTIYRLTDGKSIEYEYELMDYAAKELLSIIDKMNIMSSDEFRILKRIKDLQYSILQHYEVCNTPLLDVTQSLRVACSFASIDNDKNKGYLYVLALPYIFERISTNTLDNIRNIRLLSICSSYCKRPYFQEGYLVRDEFIDENINDKGDYNVNILDFNRRILAVYEFKNDKQFWDDEVKISREKLYPKSDIMNDISKNLKEKIYSLDDHSKKNVIIASYLNLWNRLDKKVKFMSGNGNFRKGLKSLKIENGFFKQHFEEIMSLYNFRKNLISDKGEVSYTKLISNRDMLKNILNLSGLF